MGRPFAFKGALLLALVGVLLSTSPLVAVEHRSQTDHIDHTQDGADPGMIQVHRDTGDDQHAQDGDQAKPLTERSQQVGLACGFLRLPQLVLVALTRGFNPQLVSLWSLRFQLRELVGVRARRQVKVLMLADLSEYQCSYLRYFGRDRVLLVSE